MGYQLGLLKYLVKGPFTNPVAFYIFGGGIMAIVEALPHLFEGRFVQMAVTYFLSKHLPPTSIPQVGGQVLLGTFVAGVKWFMFVPRR